MRLYYLQSNGSLREAGEGARSETQGCPRRRLPNGGVCDDVCACHRGKWWQTMANWSEGFPLLARHANNGESQAWSGWENGCQKHIHRHTNWQTQSPRLDKGVWVPHRGGGARRRSGAVQRRHKEHSLAHSDRLDFYVFIYSFCTLKNPLNWYLHSFTLLKYQKRLSSKVPKAGTDGQIFSPMG